ncbi:MAG: hypothetical protein HYZ94_02695 [Candidatus Omnitrophica bacterium]|nr:hypothetical protein [Candidatus Omnitrophota bacterium]
MKRAVFILMMFAMAAPAAAAPKEREPVTFKIVTVNPSADKTQSVPVKIELPQEVTPKDIMERGDLSVEFDDDKGSYYVFKEKVELAPKEVRVFEVVVKDLWFVPNEKVENLRNYKNIVLGRLKGTEYETSGNDLGKNIDLLLDGIKTLQEDESVSRKSRIGNYRRNLSTLDQVKEELARMEKLLAFTGGPPVPEMLEESPLKSDAPSNTTTWLVIFLILSFLGLLAGQFFFTWHRRVQGAQDATEIRDAAYSLLRKSEYGQGGPSTTRVAGKPAGGSVGTDGKVSSPKTGP